MEPDQERESRREKSECRSNAQKFEVKEGDDSLKIDQVLVDMLPGEKTRKRRRCINGTIVDAAMKGRAPTKR